jgi:hypothetical protein
VFKLILPRPDTFLNLKDELKEETSVDTDREKPNFQRNIGEKWVSTILTNPSDKNSPFFWGARVLPGTLSVSGTIGPGLSPLPPAGRQAEP